VGDIREARAKAERAAKLRGCGYSWQAIADAVGFRSRQAAKIAAERHWTRQQMSPSLTRRALVEGLMLVQQQLFEGLADAKKRNQPASVLEHTREIRSVTDQLAKLDGLHAAQKVDVSVTHTTSEALAAWRTQLLDAIDAEVVEETRAIER
jgi:hypothetical protein